MSKWVIIYSGGQIGKDGLFYDKLDMAWLPSNILAVQSDGVTCEIEYGDRETETHSSNEIDVSVSSLSWWSNVDATWQAAYDEEQAAIASLNAS